MKKKIIYLIIGLVILVLYLELGKYFNIYIPCQFKKITGYYCPGCGITRMIKALFCFDFYQAFRFNPLVFISLPFIIFFYLESIFTKKEPLYNRIPNKIWVVIIIIFIVYGFLRNIPYFDYLIPTVVR